MDAIISDDITRAAVSTSTALVAESTDLISTNAIGSRSAFGETMSETVFSSVFGATPSENAASATPDAGSVLAVDKDLSQLNNPSFVSTLQLMEKAIVGNIYEKRLIAYRDVQDAEALEEKRLQVIMQQERMSDDNAMTSSEYLAAARATTETQFDKHDVDEPGAQALQLLWSYRCELTRGRAVCYTALNKINEVRTKISVGGEPLNFLGHTCGCIWGQ